MDGYEPKQERLKCYCFPYITLKNFKFVSYFNLKEFFNVSIECVSIKGNMNIIITKIGNMNIIITKKYEIKRIYLKFKYLIKILNLLLARQWPNI